MGGAVAQHVAIAYPDRLHALVLMATAARLKVSSPILETIRNRFEHVPSLLSAVGYSPETERSRVARWAACQVQASQQVVLADFLACSQFDLRDRVGAIGCPTWILSAADDMLTPPRLQERLEQRIPRSRSAIVTRAGHFMQMERPDVVAGLLLEAAGVEPAP